MTAQPAQEEWTLGLTLGGRYAGEQHWQLSSEGGQLLARVQTDFAGVLPQIRRVQVSRMDAWTLTSLHYAEGDGRGRADFETLFDQAGGTVTLRQGREEASAALTTDYHDPVSLLLWLRTLQGESGAARLIGGRALVQCTGEAEVAGLESFVYLVRPGNAYVYAEKGGQRRLLRLVQPTEFGPVQALWESPAREGQRSRHSDKQRRRAK